MIISRYPAGNQWSDLLKRPPVDTASVTTQVASIISDVRKNGDEALRKYTGQFDKASIRSFKVSEEEIQFGLNQLDTPLLDAISLAAGNIAAFHKPQLKQEEKIETMPGVVCWRRMVPIEKVGLYIPGGTAPLFSTVLMLGIPAMIAGCKEIILCTPPLPDGSVHPAILAAASCIGITNVYKAGGVQAIAAMAYGTASVPAVDKIFGPGNQYVTAAKQLVQQDGVAIDMPAGPSEVAVYADRSADPDFIAADLLSQAEHGADSQVIMVTDHEPLIALVLESIARQLALLPRKELAEKALGNSKLILVKDTAEAMDLLNSYAPEHLILSCVQPETVAEKVINAGSVFLGHYSPESVGDYASGTNHTLPTNGYARAYSGVSVDSFVRKITFQQLGREALRNIGPAVALMAEAEGLRAHASAVNVRLSK